MRSTPGEPRSRRSPLMATIAADTISRTGNLLTAVAIPWFVLETTGSPSKTGIAVFAGAVPVVISLFFGGTLVDRFAYRRVSVVSDLASGTSVLLIPLLHAFGQLSFPLLLAFVFTGALLDLPAALARMAALPDLAKLSGMNTERAFAFSEGSSTVLGLVAPALTGVMIAAFGASNVLWIDAVSFVVSALLMATFVPDTVRETTREAGSYLHELAAGLRFVRFEPVLFPLILFFAAMNLVIGPVDALIVPVYANEVFDSAIAFGLMAAAGGVGALAGTTVMGWVGHRLSRRAVFFGGFLMVPLALAALAFTPNLPLTLAILALLGLALGLTNILEYTIYFERIPEHMRARVMGLSGAIGWATVPLGRLVGGFLIERFGLATSLALLATLFMPVPLALFAIRAFRNLGAPDSIAADKQPAPSSSG
jgi:MFS family permease